MLEFARAQGDPQVAFPALATRAQVLHEAGKHAEADAKRSTSSSHDGGRAQHLRPGPWVAEVAQVLEGLGRGPELAQGKLASTPADAVAQRRRSSTRAAMPFGPPRFTTESGAHADAAKTRLRAAELLVARGPARRRPRAQLGLALEFFRAAGAERYVREAEDAARSQLVVVPVEIVVFEQRIAVGIRLLVARR